jgi:hypothetical protein
VIVDDLNIRRAFFGPPETNPPLVINPDGMLAPSIPRQRLQSITGRNPQVIELLGSFKRFQLPPGYREYLNRKALRAEPIEDRFRDLVLEATDHGQTPYGPTDGIS